MHKYFVSESKLITPSTLLLSLKKDASESRSLVFEPGQYAAISFKHFGRPTAARCFSIVSSPTEPGILQFSMRVRGHYTKTLATLKSGDEVKVRGAFGGFVIDPSRDKEVVLLAGGIGITPFISMIRFASSTNSTVPITLLYSCQSQDDVPFAHELIKQETINPHFKVIFVFSNPPTDKFKNEKTAVGRITPELLDTVAKDSYKSKTFFICGPPPFMKGMSKTLLQKGAPLEKIITEAFGQGKNRQAGKIRSWPLNIYALSAIGVALGSFTVMVSDLLKTLPPTSSLLNSKSTTRASSLTNSRQTDLDSLVNELASTPNDAPVTAAVLQNEQLAQANISPKSATPTTTSTPRTTSTPTTPTPTAPKPTPVAAPKPKCTTTQSGVTTCV